MRVVGLDISTKTAYAVLDTPCDLVGYGMCVIDVPSDATTFQLVNLAEQQAKNIIKTVLYYCPNQIFIEQTNPSRHQSQRLLEYIHCAVIQELRKHNLQDKTIYVYTSEWRHALNLRLSKAQQKHNRQVSQGRVRGRITPKHLSVAHVNQQFETTFKLKDNDICDAINIAYYGLKHLLSQL